MIIADTSEIEKMTELLSVKSSELDDVTGKLKVLLEEMTQDLEFAQYPQSPECCESLSGVTTRLTQLNDKVQTFKNLLLQVPEEYLTRESEYKNLLSSMTKQLGKLDSYSGTADFYNSTSVDTESDNEN